MARLTVAPSHRAGFEKRAGIAAMCIAMALLPIGDAISKTLTGFATPFEVTVWRTLVQAAFFVPVAVILRRHLRGSILSVGSLVSALLIVTVTLSLVTAFASMPIATAIAIFFVEPLLLTLLAGPFLGEVPGPRRYAAVGVGLIGALIVIRPNFIAFGPIVLLPVLAALAYALNMIVMRKATRDRSALTFQFGASLSAAAIILVAQLVAIALGFERVAFSELPVWVFWLVLGAGALAMVAFLAITFAFSKTEASLLAPFQYLEIVGATLVGFLVFGEIPDGITLLGTAIILGSGAYVFYRERKHEVEAATSQPIER
ncbi:EamA domain-containing membrane protein RarD [Rhodovulum sp. ES.010]|uniref:DMT family transporter n=1 Tax=Rhodovulum sp. ES.010 TaxID=1882821 RepID=UPI00092BB3E0|nr:DMT family transporter [Rhodovulum sp. ES.010]SIO32083.1 EamA domain-containing membrane protein RarD [Rhodovulum sp. ES.010]